MNHDKKTYRSDMQIKFEMLNTLLPGEQKQISIERICNVSSNRFRDHMGELIKSGYVISKPSNERRKNGFITYFELTPKGIELAIHLNQFSATLKKLGWHL